MKIEQIQYVLSLYETKSISKTADRFYMSRPNLSNAVRSLEQELGFSIIERGTRGVSFTPKGRQLIGNAQNLMREIGEIRKLGDEHSRRQFGIVNPHCFMVENAFSRLCRMTEENDPAFDRYRLSIYQGDQFESMRLLHQKMAELAITVSSDLRAPSLTRELADMGLVYKKLTDADCYVNISKNHPLVRNGSFSLKELKNYPFAGYAPDIDHNSPFRHMSEFSFIDLSRLILTEDGRTRSRIVSETNAYSVGISMPAEWEERLGLCCIPIPKARLEVGYIRRSGEPVSETEELFMRLLDEEMQYLKA